MTEMSVIVITPDRYTTIRRLLDCLAAQTIREHLEIIIVAPAEIRLELDQKLLQSFGGMHVEGVQSIESFAEAQAIGVRAATSPIVAFTEDHSFPDPDWAENLVYAYRKGWAAVGPEVANGNPRSLISWTNLAIEYGKWLAPADSNVVNHLPGHNSSYKRDILLRYGNKLGTWLEAESILHWDLTSKGYKLWLESSARTAHQNFSDFFWSIRLRFCCGMVFAASRVRTWSRVMRFVYFCGSPLIPFVRLYRIMRELRRPGRPRRLIPRMAPLLLLFLVCDGFGEMVGYAFASGKAVMRLTEMEFHRERFMNSVDRLEFIA